MELHVEALSVPGKRSFETGLSPGGVLCVMIPNTFDVFPVAPLCVRTLFDLVAVCIIHLWL